MTEHSAQTHGRLVGWLSLAQLINWSSIFYAFSLVMAAVLYSPAFAVVTRRFPHDFRRAIITMTFLGGLASTVFIPLTAWLIATWGWHSAISSLALLHLLVCTLRKGTPRSTARRAICGLRPSSWWRCL